MCFSPKVTTSAPSTAVPEPAPLAEEVKGVDIGAEEGTDNTETTGIKDLKVSKTSTSTTKDSSSVSRAIRKTGVNIGS